MRRLRLRANQHKCRHSPAPNLVIGLMFVGTVCVTIALLLTFCATTNAEDAPIQCMPSGFTIGIPPFHVSHDFQARNESIPLHLEPLQNQLAEVLSKSGLFSNVAVLREAPRPDSTDLTLLVSISSVREVEGSGGPRPGRRATRISQVDFVWWQGLVWQRSLLLECR